MSSKVKAFAIISHFTNIGNDSAVVAIWTAQPSAEYAAVVGDFTLSNEASTLWDFPDTVKLIQGRLKDAIKDSIVAQLVAEPITADDITFNFLAD